MHRKGSRRTDAGTSVNRKLSFSKQNRQYRASPQADTPVFLYADFQRHAFMHREAEHSAPA